MSVAINQACHQVGPVIGCIYVYIVSFDQLQLGFKWLLTMPNANAAYRDIFPYFFDEFWA